MKSLLLTLLLALGAMGASAQNYEYLVLQQTDGSLTSMGIDGLKITFSGGRMTVDNGTDKAVVELVRMQRMYFSSVPASIDQTPSAEDEIGATVENGRLHVNAPAGARVSIYSVDGRRVNGENLKKGAYVVRINDRSFKVIAR